MKYLRKEIVWISAHLQTHCGLDTETTGLNPQEGHRIIEIGCVEMVKRRLTGKRFHVYINPDRIIDEAQLQFTVSPTSF